MKELKRKLEDKISSLEEDVFMNSSAEETYENVLKCLGNCILPVEEILSIKVIILDGFNKAENRKENNKFMFRICSKMDNNNEAYLTELGVILNFESVEEAKQYIAKYLELTDFEMELECIYIKEIKDNDE